MILGFGKSHKFDFERWAAGTMWEDSAWLARAFWKRIVCFGLLGLAAAAAYNRWSPEEYVSRATVRFIPSQVGENYVTSNVAMQVEQRIFAVMQLANSRLTATQMIETFGLYPQRRRFYPIADLVPEFHERLAVSTVVADNTAKTVPSILISFRDASPETAQKVVQRIVELIYEENRRYRSDQSIGTTDFLDQELQLVTTQMRNLEDRLAKLPTPGGEDKEYRNILKVENLHSLERRVTEIEHDMSFVLTDRNLRKSQVAEMELQLARRTEQGLTKAPVATMQTERLRTSLAAAETTHEALRRRYKPTSADVLGAAETVGRMEAQLAAQVRQEAQSEYDREMAVLRGQLGRVKADLAGYEETLRKHTNEQARLNTEIGRIRAQFAVGTDVENERLHLMREYESSKTHYAELSRRQRESQLASDMERRGHGETAELVEPPTAPSRAESPTETTRLGAGIAVGLLMGYFLGTLSFFSKPRVRTPRHIGILGDYPVLITLPAGRPLRQALRSVASQSSVLALLCAVTLLTGCARSAAERLTAELSAGNAAVSAGDFRVAELRFRRAVQIDPRNGEAYLALARLYTSRGEPVRSYEQFLRAAELLPARAEVQEQVADLTYQIYFADPGRPVTLLREIEARANSLTKTWPERAAGYRLAGQVLVERHHAQEAVELMEAALESIEDGSLRTQLAAVYFQGGDRGRAEQHLRHSMRVNPKYTSAFDLLYLQLMDRGAARAARDVLAAKVREDPGLDAGLQLAAHDDAWGGRQLAEELLDRLSRDFAGAPETFARIGDFWLHRQELASARRWYDTGLARHPKSRGLYIGRQAEALVAEKNLAGAQALIDQALTADPDDASLRAYRAALALDTPSDLDRHKMQGELEAVLTKMPNSPFVRLHLGRAYLLSGDLLRAGEQFRTALTLDPNYAPGWLALADVELRSGNTERAQERLSALLRRAPGYGPAKLLHAQASLAENRAGEAERALSGLLDADPEDVEVMIALARAKAGLGQRAEGSRLLARAAELRPDDPRPVLLAARLDVEGGENRNALERLLSAQKRLPGSPEIASMLGSVALIADRASLALEQFERLLKQDEQNLQYRLGYASSLAVAGRTEQAKQEFERVQKKSGGDAQPWLLYGAMLSSAGNTEAAQTAYREALRRDAKNPYALNNLAFSLARQGRELDRALELAEEARRILPRSRQINDTLAYIYVRKGMQRNATAALEQLAAELPASQQRRTRLLLDRIRQGDFAKVRQEMEQSDGWN